VPSNTEHVGPLVLSKREFSRLQNASTVRTKSALQRERQELAQVSFLIMHVYICVCVCVSVCVCVCVPLADRKSRLESVNAHFDFEAREEEMAALAQRKHETTRTTAAQQPSELDVEAQQKNRELLAAAQRMIEEQEDEIRKMNEMIAQAKVRVCACVRAFCTYSLPLSLSLSLSISLSQRARQALGMLTRPQVYAIRDAQLAEKEAIKRELIEEERRLDDVRGPCCRLGCLVVSLACPVVCRPRFGFSCFVSFPRLWFGQADG
jgi:hypothetical protein